LRCNMRLDAIPVVARILWVGRGRGGRVRRGCCLIVGVRAEGVVGFVRRGHAVASSAATIA
jgi:hypothetical protein